ncbi:hypothetical protein EJB05_36764 [Eragrostis curvula]|uniref:peptidyl-tRNA hydrolase n=1 Tax=Eragrostis curvula TaxID=38414 RepID=A0A5J9UBH9_9POAL|nr:hypothetical protein EJB05_36764 [Eragrostis curvula]
MAPPPRRNPPQNPRRKGEEPWLAASLRAANFLPGLAIGFLLGLFLDLSSSWKPRLGPATAPAAASARGSSSKRASGSSSATGGEELKMDSIVKYFQCFSRTSGSQDGGWKNSISMCPCSDWLVCRIDVKYFVKVGRDFPSPAVSLFSNRGLLRQWEQFGQAKIVLTCKNQQEMNRIKETAEHRGIPTFVVADAGRTQVVAGSKTVLAVGPDRCLSTSKAQGAFDRYIRHSLI